MFPLLFKASKKDIEDHRFLRPSERAIQEHKNLCWWTNLGLGIAVVIGFIVIYAHGGVHTAGIAAFGASLGTGGVLGFLFGVPSASKAPVTITSTGSVAVSTGSDSKTTGGNLNETAAANSAGAPPKPALVTNPPAPGDGPAPEPSTTAMDDPSLAPMSHYKTSNLEQVADWVTKLLLGGGLTQMQHIPPLVWRWAQIVAWGIVGGETVSDQRMRAEQAFGGGLLVYGFVLGFFAGFLITKLQLGKEIAD
jgi:hypothetical protein